MSESSCPACGSEVSFQAMDYGRSNENYQGFCCPHCGGIGLRMRAVKHTPALEVSYPALIPFGALSRIRFVLAEHQRDSYTFVSKKSRHILDSVLVEQLTAEPEPELSAEFY